jgi:hypothetical protein
MMLRILMQTIIKKSKLETVLMSKFIGKSQCMIYNEKGKERKKEN